jgi:hypothetical protein
LEDCPVSTPATNLVEAIPPAAEVRSRLMEALRETALLRDLLKVSERKERVESKRPAGGKEASRA